MQRLNLIVALVFAGCAGAGQAPKDLSGGSDFSSGGPDLMGVSDGAGGPDDGGVPALADVTPQVTFIAVGKAFPLSAVFAASYFGAQPVDVAFLSSDPAVVTVQSPGQLAFNTSEAMVMGAAVKVGDAVVTASINGMMKSATVHVVPSVMALTPAPLKVQVGKSATLTVTLSSPALAGGADVMLQSADPKIATLPGMVNVPMGMSSATVMVSGLAIGQVAVTATYATSMATVQVMTIDPVNRLVVSELLYDAMGADDGFEWIELFNGTNAPVDLTGYFLATTASSMNVVYTAVTPALVGTLMPGDCKVVGGPMADPKANGLPLNFMYFQSVKFNPNLPNGSATPAEGIALYRGVPNMVNGATMIDAVIYGTMQRGIVDEAGMTNRLDVDYVKFPGQTLERFGPKSWRVQNSPTGGNCDWLHL